MGRVFLSYARDDVDAAKHLAESISNAGHDVWWDRHLHGGSRFAAEIDRALKEADAVVVLWSEASVGSAWVQDEATEGRDTGRLIPVTLGSTKPPLGFRQFQTIDLGSWNGSGSPQAADELLDAIRRTCGGDAHEQKPTAPAAARGSRRRASVCVLPFINMSGEPEQEYFSDGITEDIITDLSKVSALSVIARNTAFTFKGQAIDVKEVASTLGVSHVLEGSVRKAGSRVRITAQLIDGAAGDHVWADRYDRDLTDIFAIQDEISKAIVDALQLKLLPKEKSAIESRGTSNVDAYNLYLMARQQWIGASFGSRRDEAIVRICRQATVLDPNYAHAWALIALAQSELRFWHGKDEQNALDAAERALAIDLDLPEARCVKARYLEEAGRQDEANREIEQALKLDPESWEVNREAARMMFRQGRIREAVPFFEKAAALMDTDYHNPSMLLTCYLSLGDEGNRERTAKVVLDRTERALAKDPTAALAAAYGASALATLGDRRRAKDWIERALLLEPDNLSMRYNLACALIVDLHDTDAGLNVLEPFFEKVISPTHIKHMEADPDFDSVRDHPRFRQMLASAKGRLGLATTAA
ncbi:MAG: TIR domain-containing protein [Sphingomicrobium sp.]